jgi:hypothetical protein
MLMGAGDDRSNRSTSRRRPVGGTRVIRQSLHNSYCENQGCNSVSSSPEKPCATSGVESITAIIAALTRRCR